jgi:hypothetical protein
MALGSKQGPVENLTRLMQAAQAVPRSAAALALREEAMTATCLRAAAAAANARCQARRSESFGWPGFARSKRPWSPSAGRMAAGGICCDGGVSSGCGGGGGGGAR